MDTIISAVVIGIAAAYLLRRWLKGGGASCRDCPGCSQTMGQLSCNGWSEGRCPSSKERRLQPVVNAEQGAENKER